MRFFNIQAIVTFYLVILSCSVASAQKLFPNPQGIRFLGTNGKDTLAYPFSGGFLNPQFSNIDLNGDKLQDIFVYDPTDETVTTFLNLGDGQYGHAPNYESLFPQLTNWAILYDYNHDGKADLFTYSLQTSGLAVYRNSGDTVPKFVRMTEQLEYQDIGYRTNLYVGAQDIPFLGDVDGDGEMDVLTMDVFASFVQYYRSNRKDRKLHPDSLSFEIADRCWGKFESTFTDTMKLGQSCGKVKKRREAHGATSLMAIDLDGDGDRDLRVSNLFYASVLYMENGRKRTGKPDFAYDTMVYQKSGWPLNGKSVNLSYYPVAFLLDVNSDGKQDLVFSPMSEGESLNKDHLWLYINTGTQAKPDFVYIESDFLEKNTISNGSRTSPAFWDYNNDGLTDLVMTGQGNTGLAYKYDRLILYENIGTINKAVYKKVNDDLGGLSSLKEANLRPAFADLDGDNKADLILGKEDGTLVYIPYSGSVSGLPTFGTPVSEYAQIETGQNAAPALYDIDGDGLTDLVIGKRNGQISYYRNTGSKQTPAFTKVTDSLGQVRTNGYYWQYIYDQITGDLIDSAWTMEPNGYSAPALGDLDNNGDPDLVSGSARGNLFIYMNIRNSLAGKFQRASSPLYNMLQGTYENKDFGQITRPAMAELNGDTIPELFIGTFRGGLTSYGSQESVLHVGILPERKTTPVEFTVYPNPANGPFYIKWESMYTHDKATVRLINVLGQTLHTQQLLQPGTSVISPPNLPEGLYIIQLETTSGSKVSARLLMEGR